MAYKIIVSNIIQRERRPMVTDQVRTFYLRRGQYQEYFVQFLGWFEHPEYLYIAMVIMPHDDLQQYIDDKAPFPESESSIIAKQFATGLRFMHQKGFLHRDLKPLVGLQSTCHHRHTPTW